MTQDEEDVYGIKDKTPHETRQCQSYIQSVSVSLATSDLPRVILSNTPPHRPEAVTVIIKLGRSAWDSLGESSLPQSRQKIRKQFRIMDSICIRLNILGYKPKFGAPGPITLLV